MKKTILVPFAFILVVACSSLNPITGKRPLKTVSNGALFQMSFQQYREVIKTEEISSNRSEVVRIRRVGDKIQREVELYLQQKGKSDFLQGYDWEYNLIVGDQINAWCMPGGKIAFYTGIMPICKDDNGIAVVMAHEMVHALADHAAQRMSQGQLAQVGQVVGMVALGASGVGGIGIDTFGQLYGLGATIGLMSYSRKHETEADLIGLEFMARAGYDPREAPRFWVRMEEFAAEKAKESTGNSQERPPEFFSTHPSPDTRMKNLEDKIPEVLPLYYAAIATN